MNILTWATRATVVALMMILVGCDRSSENSGGTSSNQGNGTSKGQDTSSSSAPDNTGRNVRDRGDSTLTPGDQGQSDADRTITRQIRRALASNDQLSTEAKNIKIITTNGKVTLRGPVKSSQEKDTIQSIVQQAGVSSFENQLEVDTTTNKQ